MEPSFSVDSNVQAAGGQIKRFDAGDYFNPRILKHHPTETTLLIPSEPRWNSNLMIALSLCFPNFCLGLSYAIMAPFYPLMAERKGSTSTETGLVIGIFSIAVFVSSPVYGKLMPSIMPKFLAVGGLFMTGILTFLFGVLEWSPPGAIFLIQSLVLRAATGLALAAVNTAIYTTIIGKFPNRVATLLAATSMFYGFGLILGPAVGGILNEAGGFKCSFFVLGGLTTVSCVLCSLTYPDTDISTDASERQVKLMEFFSHFGTLLNFTVIFNSYLLLGFNEATLALHLDAVTALTSAQTGAVFLVSGLFYAISTQITGYFADKVNAYYNIVLVGISFGIVGYSFCGPAYPLPIEPNIWTIVLSQMSIGLGIGCQTLGSLNQVVKDSKSRGYSDNISTFAFISCSFTSSQALGISLGPIIGGFLLDAYGYKLACLVVVLPQIILIICLLIIRKRRS